MTTDHSTLRDRSGFFTQIRREIHQNPELGLETPHTSERVASLLEGWGYEVHRGIGGHGVVGVLRKGNGPRRLGIRADMDALPIIERNGLPWASQHPGRMHACGHDGHTATLLAAAEQLALNCEFNGTLNLIFQPDEEGLMGAVSMIQDGLFTRFPCDAVFALHNMPGLDVGQAVVSDGGTAASSERVRIIIKGKGGHGAMPSRAIDPIPAMASIITALQTVISRNLDSNESAVISIGQVHTGSAYNIIPEQVDIELGVRTLSREVRDRVETRIREIVQGQAAAFNVEVEIDYTLLAPVLVNTPKETAQMLAAARRVLGNEHVLEKLPARLMGSEDFAWMLHQIPGCYFLLGNGKGQFTGCSPHNDKYDFNDEIIPLGAGCWVELAREILI
ncbi:amidohydrolase [Pseudomonas sp. BN505]|uniref:M20 aminoacylase family protein n=1 Tax=unclassified Pseudomonas TaxID=196821 RepID=UPI00245677E6|nr:MULTISPECIES: M20 aminoacylase family protein [unclassified Pseudomonas]MDH4842266.1 amidohydrolase [Pseudomonas sp. BN605]MDH4855121.1 amidohydrolase [Pseudomonas sp. BN505]